MKKISKALAIALAILSAPAYAATKEVSCAAGHEEKLNSEILARVGVLAERTKKKLGIEYSLEEIARDTRFQSVFFDLATSLMGDISLTMQSGYTTAKGTKLVFAFTDSMDPKQKLESASERIALDSFLTGQKHDREGNITSPGRCEVRAAVFAGRKVGNYVLSLFNAETGIWINGVDLSAERIRIF